MSVVKSKRNESKNEFEALYFKLADSVDNFVEEEAYWLITMHTTIPYTVWTTYIALYFQIKYKISAKVETNSVLTFILMQIKMILKQFYHERESEF